MLISLDNVGLPVPFALLPALVLHPVEGVTMRPNDVVRFDINVDVKIWVRSQVTVQGVGRFGSSEATA